MAEEPALVLGRTLHLTVDGVVVEENDPASYKVLGGPGLAISAEDAAKYGLTEELHGGYDPEPPPPEGSIDYQRAEEPLGDLEAKTVVDLKMLARARRIKGYNTLNKEDLIVALRATEQPQG